MRSYSRLSALILSCFVVFGMGCTADPISKGNRSNPAYKATTAHGLELLAHGHYLETLASYSLNHRAKFAVIGIPAKLRKAKIKHVSGPFKNRCIALTANPAGLFLFERKGSRWEFTTDYISFLTSNRTAEILVAALSPQADRIVFIEGQSGSELSLLNILHLDDRRVEPIMTAKTDGEQIGWSSDGKFILFLGPAKKEEEERFNLPGSLNVLDPVTRKVRTLGTTETPFRATTTLASDLGSNVLLHRDGMIGKDYEFSVATISGSSSVGWRSVPYGRGLPSRVRYLLSGGQFLAEVEASSWQNSVEVEFGERSFSTGNPAGQSMIYELVVTDPQLQTIRRIARINNIYLTYSIGFSGP
jgi:hypothetical protein